jgi:hypothetical protein
MTGSGMMHGGATGLHWIWMVLIAAVLILAIAALVKYLKK